MSSGVEFVEASEGRVYRLGGRLVSAHLLVDDDGLVVVDSGLSSAKTLWRVLGEIGRSPDEVKAILLTHGHLDHTGGAYEIQQATGATVWVHPADRVHVEGLVSYRGWARGCGWLEWAGRSVFRYRPPEIRGELEDGQRFPWWGGLRVVHLPGHTPGHCGFLSERTGWLFAGDVFASYGWSVHLPPRIFNRDPLAVRSSLRKVASMELTGVVPSHYDVLAPSLHWRRLLKLAVNRH